MKYKIVELEDLTGNETSIYSVIIDNDNITLFEKFLMEYEILFKYEINSILDRLDVIANKTGAREIFFKTKEGELGDGVEALFDLPGKRLRLYCIRYGTQIVIAGGGGSKPKNIRAFQEDEKLKKENYLLRKISKEITERIKDKRITYSLDELYFEGELEFEDKTDE